MRAAFGCVLILFVAPDPASAQPVTVPTDLAVGAQYRLAFVTSTVTPATSTDIAFYNSFVDDLGDTVLTGNWTAIASTFATNARTNTGTTGTGGVPIYLLDGTKLVEDYDDLWDGSIDVNLNLTETLATANSEVWTGTSATGTTANPLGGPPLTVGPEGRAGSSGSSDGEWVSKLENTSNLPFNRSLSSVFRLYGLSEVLTVSGGASVPEPGTFVLAGLLSTAVFWRRFARRRKRRSHCSSTDPAHS